MEIAAITGNMHRSLRYFVLLERITSYYYYYYYHYHNFIGVSQFHFLCPYIF